MVGLELIGKSGNRSCPRMARPNQPQHLTRPCGARDRRGRHRTTALQGTHQRGRVGACMPSTTAMRRWPGQFVELMSLSFKCCNPASVLPKFYVVTVNHSLGTFLCSVVIVANEIDGLMK